MSTGGTYSKSSALPVSDLEFAYSLFTELNTISSINIFWVEAFAWLICKKRRSSSELISRPPYEPEIPSRPPGRLYLSNPPDTGAYHLNTKKLTACLSLSLIAHLWPFCGATLFPGLVHSA
ncbi:hypothetical protein HD806DRAFT_204230 [Xylariaceae sp. AK1471]|nr:hypothetical protein HD806DRAFT_204230 [Xylariaceae sp. AK1471]